MTRREFCKGSAGLAGILAAGASSLRRTCSTGWNASARARTRTRRSRRATATRSRSSWPTRRCAPACARRSIPWRVRCWRANSSALRHGQNRATERVVVSNCQIKSHAGALSFCWLGDGVIRDCTFSNIVCTDSAYGISFAFPKFEQGMTDFGDEETLVENLSFDNIVLDRIYATPVSVDVADDPMARFNGFRNVSFSNVRARALGFPSLHGRKSNPLENVVFSNCSFTKCAPEGFPEKYQQKGAAYWFDPSKPQTLSGVKGVRFDGCTFDEE